MTSEQCLGWTAEGAWLEVITPQGLRACATISLVLCVDLAWLKDLRDVQVLREFAIAAGLGRKRPRPRKEARPKMGSEGEDVVADEAGGLKLHCPARFQPGTMKAAAWQVHPNFPFTFAHILEEEGLTSFAGL